MQVTRYFFTTWQSPISRNWWLLHLYFQFLYSLYSYFNTAEEGTCWFHDNSFSDL